MSRPKIPRPIYDGRRRRFWLSEVRAYEAELAGIPPPEPVDPADDRLITAQELCRRHGFSEETLHRRLRQEADDEQAA